MKAFNGKEFLAAKGVKIELTNGASFEINEVRPEQLDAVMAMPDEPQAADITKAVSSMLGCDPKELKAIGIVELKGVMDFLSENLLS